MNPACAQRAGEVQYDSFKYLPTSLQDILGLAELRPGSCLQLTLTPIQLLSYSCLRKSTSHTGKESKSRKPLFNISSRLILLRFCPFIIRFIKPTWQWRPPCQPAPWSAALGTESLITEPTDTPTSTWVLGEWHSLSSRAITDCSSSIECANCSRKLFRSRYSNNQIQKFQEKVYHARRGGEAAELPRCRDCTADNRVELKCTGCMFTKGIDCFAKAQRKDPDNAVSTVVPRARIH